MCKSAKRQTLVRKDVSRPNTYLLEISTRTTKSALRGGRASRPTRFSRLFRARTTPSIQSSDESMRFRQSIKIRNLDNYEVALDLQVKIGPFQRTCASSPLLQIVPGKGLQVASGHTVLTEERRFLYLSPGRRYQRFQVPIRQTITNSQRLAKHYIRYP